MMKETQPKVRNRYPEGMRLRGKVYYAWFKHNGREVKKRLSSDLSTAKSMFRDLRGRIERGDWGILDNDCPWNEVKEQFIAVARQSLRNADDYEADINRFETFRRVQSIKQIDAKYVTAYRAWRLSQRVGKPPKNGESDERRFVTPRTVNREVGTLRSMLNKAVAWKMIGVNPISKLKPLTHDTPAKIRRALDHSEVIALFEALPSYLRPIIQFIAVTGCRENEAVELLWSDIDFENRIVRIRANLAKNSKSREIPLDDNMAALLVRERNHAKSRTPIEGNCATASARQAARFSKDHVFVTNANTPFRNNLLKRFYKYAQKAGIDDARPRGSVDIHSLRTTFMTLAIANGASPKAIQEIVGHSSLEMTMNVYAKATDRAKRAAISALPFARSTSPEHVLEINPEVYEGSTTRAYAT